MPFAGTPRTNCLRGWGYSNLWSDFLRDRWSSSTRKKLELNTKSHSCVTERVFRFTPWRPSKFSVGHLVVRILPPPARHSKVRETRSPVARKARQWAPFAPLRSVSTFRIGDLGERNCEKCPSDAANIPVFERLQPEIWFDRHCRPTLAEWTTICGKLQNGAQGTR
jgi:hypothetical protein